MKLDEDDKLLLFVIWCMIVAFFYAFKEGLADQIVMPLVAIFFGISVGLSVYFADRIVSHRLRALSTSVKKILVVLFSLLLLVIIFCLPFVAVKAIKEIWP